MILIFFCIAQIIVGVKVFMGALTNSKFTPLVEKCEWATIQCKIIKAELFSTSPYMPCLTLWDKIPQNLVHLEANSHKIIKSRRIFRPSYTTFYEEITYNVNHTLLFLSQDSYIKVKAFDYFGGASMWFLSNLT